MRFEYRRGDAVHRVDLLELGEGRWRATWSLRAAEAEPGAPAEPLAERELELEALPVGPSAYSLRLGHEMAELRVERQGVSRTVVRDGEAVSFEHLDPYSAAGGSGPGRAGGPAEIASPMPGRVVELHVAEGEQVEEGRTVVVVEAMKMANEYRAPFDGTVTAVRCAVGDTVDGGDVLLVVTPET